MKLRSRATFQLASSFLASVLLLSSPADAQELQWFKGNTHAHGVVEGYGERTAPDWYHAHGYHFMVRTEHEKIVDADLEDDARDGFLVIPGQEITQIVRDPAHPDGFRHAHVTGIGLRNVIEPALVSKLDWASGGKFADPEERVAWTLKVQAAAAAHLTVGQSFQRNIAAVRAQGGIAQVNHPNFHWSVRPDDFNGLEGPFLLEIANGYPFANNKGGASPSGEIALSTEGMWDKLLSEGKSVWAVASDDAHDYRNFDQSYALTPGKGWIFVRAATLDREAILTAIRAGNFYASNGVELRAIRSDARSLSIEIFQPRSVGFTLNGPPALPSSARFTTTFIGAHGRILKREVGMSPRYAFKGDEVYVRAVIEDSDGRRAWTQPVFLDGRTADRRTP